MDRVIQFRIGTGRVDKQVVCVYILLSSEEASLERKRVERDEAKVNITAIKMVLK